MAAGPRNSAFLAFALIAVVLSGACAKKRASGGLTVSSVQRVDCTPATDAPVFRMIATSTNGAPISGGAATISAVRLTVDGEQVRPFYVAPFGSDSHPRLTLILVDVSGSMAGNSFATAQRALNRFVQDFDPAVDRLAIAPFGSRNVAAQINSAVFVGSKEDAQKTITAIPAPRSENNTALYSAVSAGLDALAEHAKTVPGDPQLLLIVLTDGKNDVQPQDLAQDPHLLAGAAGLSQVTAKLRASRVQTYTIGFGRREQVNESDLQKLGRGRTRIVQSASDLENVFGEARRLATSSVMVDFTRPGAERYSGRDMKVGLALDAPVGAVEGSGSWQAPQFSPGVADSICSVSERKAALNLPVISEPGQDLLHTLLVFCVIGVVLAFAWLLVPRLIWNDFESAPYRPPANWGGTDDGSSIGISHERTPDDATRAVPRSDGSRFQKR